MVDYLLNYLKPGNAQYKGKTNDAVRYSLDEQLLDSETWRRFVEVYRHPSDDVDNGWRNEYWGKMMRGGCLTYMYCGDERLYSVLEGAVTDLLSVNPVSGAFTTYSEDRQFNGWDMWGRKYIITGLQHFYRICKEDSLKERILAALIKHADCVLDKVGKDKIEITKTSQWWLGINSCSILEPFVELYKMTKEQRYLDFAEYILSTGGCDGDDNLIKMAIDNKKMPYEYPETKAYETMSFFEGVLAYYEITGNEYYLDAVTKFVDAVARTDVTTIGCCGCTHELFDNSYEKQTEYSEGIMQETCVTVTWMRLNARLFMLTGDCKYYNRIEISGYNAMYGSFNTEHVIQPNMELDHHLPFDSYSPLFNNRRGKGVGGLKHFEFGGYYGCCACIASAGTALMPLLAVVESDKGLVISGYAKGEVETSFGTITVETEYPVSYKINISVACEKSFEMKLRIPEFFENTYLSVSGKKIDTIAENGYISIIANNNDNIILNADVEITEEKLNGKKSYHYGPVVLARDMAKENNRPDFNESIEIAGFEKSIPEGDEILRFTAELKNGNKVPFTDYSSCGREWLSETSSITVWNK